MNDTLILALRVAIWRASRMIERDVGPRDAAESTRP